VCSFDAESGRLTIEGESLHGLAAQTQEACLHNIDSQEKDRELYIQCLHHGGKTTGALGFEGGFEDESIPLALSVLAVTAIERIHAFRHAGRAAADAEAEMLRSAILDAFAHEFKTPLASILAAAGGLRETSVQPGEQELVDIIENQALRLSHLATRLLRTARLDREEVKPRMERTSLSPLLQDLIDQHRSQFGRPIAAKLGREMPEIMADPELLSLAVNQLLDNARKYSSPGSVVAVELGVADGAAEVRVTNGGRSIKPEEQEQIFERFFRGSATERITPGTGLGLYVARKIVRAHGGQLELDRTGPAHEATTFRIKLPVIPYEQHDEQEAHQSLSSGR
jgi:two-component system sensor histidine kinase KdpD